MVMHDAPADTPGVELYETTRRSIDAVGVREEVGLVGRIAVGLGVLGRDLEPVGRIKEISGTGFLVARAILGDVWVPLSAIQSVSDGRVVLDIDHDDVDDTDWLLPIPEVGFTQSSAG